MKYLTRIIVICFGIALAAPMLTCTRGEYKAEEVSPIVIPTEPARAVECIDVSDCPDLNACTVCEEGLCLVDPDCCLTDADCTNPDLPFCNTVKNECVECLEDAQCDDGNKCTEDSCNLANNTCDNKAILNCCLSDEDCKDNDVCTSDTCKTENGTCQNDPIDGCCTSEEQCNDNDDCTTDACVENTCSNDLGQSYECSDSNPCTSGACVGCFCVQTPVCGNSQLDNGERCDPPGDHCSPTCQCMATEKGPKDFTGIEIRECAPEGDVYCCDEGSICREANGPPDTVTAAGGVFTFCCMGEGQGCTDNICCPTLKCNANQICEGCIALGENCNPNNICCEGGCYNDKCTYCGNGSCESWENCSLCPEDCGICPSVCGDGICGADEVCDVCIDDCGYCPPSCANIGDSCSEIPCCYGACVDGVCSCGRNFDRGTFCHRDADPPQCCAGLSCEERNICCTQNGKGCTVNTDCCSGYCNVNKCSRPR